MIDYGKELQMAYDDGYKQGRYDEMVETEMSLPMTTQEAIKVLQIMRNAIENGDWIQSNDNEVLEMAIEALSNNQNPSVSEVKTNTNSVSEADVIYRRDAIDAIQKWRVVYDEDTDLIDTIKQLPSAQPKIGRWIHDGSKWTNRWICSECGYKWFFDCIEGAFCPNCGADMRGEQDG